MIFTNLFILFVLGAGSVAGAELFRDDFSRFPPGWLTSPVGALNGAIQEYHYLPHRGVPLGPWENAICHLDAWVVGDEEANPTSSSNSTPPSQASGRPRSSSPAIRSGATTPSK